MNEAEWGACGLATAISAVTLGFCAWIAQSSIVKENEIPIKRIKSTSPVEAFDDLIALSKSQGNPIINGKVCGTRLNHPSINYDVLHDHYGQIQLQLKPGVNIVRYADSDRILLFILGYEKDPYPICLYQYGKEKIKALYIRLPKERTKTLCTRRAVCKYIEDYCHGFY